MSKSNNLENNLKNILWKNDKVIIFLVTFYIFHKNGVKTFLK